MNARLTSAIPQFVVPDVVQTSRYYERVLGFQLVGYWDGEIAHRDDGSRAVFAIVQRDSVRIHFSRAESSYERPKRTDGGYDIFFDVAGVDELAHELVDRGAEIVDGPEDRPYGQRELVLRDCNGLLLAFAEAKVSTKYVGS